MKYIGIGLMWLGYVIIMAGICLPPNKGEFFVTASLIALGIGVVLVLVSSIVAEVKDCFPISKKGGFGGY